MSSGLALRSDPAPILACTVSRNVHHFDLLIEDMEAELGDAWGDLTFDEARAFLDQPDAARLEFLALALTATDTDDLGQIGDLIRVCKQRSVQTLIVAHDLVPAALHELLRLGADDFVPYPLGEGALHDALARLRSARTTPAQTPQPPALAKVTPLAAGPETRTPDRADAPPVVIPPRKTGQAAVFAVQGLAGGTGASTLAVNLAWELATIDKVSPPSVCLMDLDLQAGTISTYLDLPRRDLVIELLQDAHAMDADAFKQALVGYENKLSVFPAPPELLPLDLIGPDEVEALLALATQSFDIVVIDMPHTMVMWTETVLKRADVYFTTLELDMRSAQNAVKFLKALTAEALPLEKVNFVLNRAPGLTDLNGKARARKLAESLGITIGTQLPDGGKQVCQSGDHGQPLALGARKNALRRDIAKLATGLHKAMAADAPANP